MEDNTEPYAAPELDPVIVALAVKLVQPGMLSDIANGISRLISGSDEIFFDKKKLSLLLERLVFEDIIKLYAGRRYIVTDQGERMLRFSGVAFDIDVRRMYLLLETRRDMKRKRSDTRERSLNQ